MERAIGWLLDVTVERNAATLWIKTLAGGILRLADKYQPCFYILPKNEHGGVELFHILSQQLKIRVEWQSKHTDINHDGYERLLCIYAESIYYHNTLSKRLQNDPSVAQLFNTELSHIQQYLSTRLKVEPTSKVQVQYDDECLISLTKIDELDVPPPFTTLHFDVITSSLDPYDINDPIRQISAKYQEEPEVTFEGSEETILRDFCKYVVTNDPDIVNSITKQHYKSPSVLRYLFARIEDLRIDIELGRCGKSMGNTIEGRIYLESESTDSLVGLVEKARFACLPLGLSERYRISRLIDSRNCYELINRGFVIMRSDKRLSESIRTVEEIFVKDKGGMIFSPRVGLHENVAVLDYENEYANLIITHNLSYGRTPHGKGLLPAVVDSVLKRRTMFKNLQKSLVITSKEWLWCV